MVEEFHEREDVYTIYLLNLVKHNSCKNFVITENRRIGMASQNVKVGDVVALLLGSRVPVILRPSGSTYSFVGLSYVHGLMNGEGLIEVRNRQNIDDGSNEQIWLKNFDQSSLKSEALVLV